MRADLRQALRDRSDLMLPPLRQTLQSRRALIAAITAAPHDRAVTEAAMNRFRADLDRLLQAAQVVVLDRLDEG